VFSADYDVTAADDAMQLIDLSGDSVFVTGTFRVGLEFHASGLPSVARDDDGIKPNTNYLLGNGLGWVESSTQGLTDDWILRTVVDGDMGALPDAGVPVPDAGVGTPDAAVGQPDAGGGADCTANSQCPSGQYCGSSNVCTFDCRTADDCGDNMSCNSLGQCVAAADDSGCGCSASSRGGGGTASLGLLLICAVALARRRR